jgi:hypothetical protein
MVSRHPPGTTSIILTFKPHKESPPMASSQKDHSITCYKGLLSPISMVKGINTIQYNNTTTITITTSQIIKSPFSQHAAHSYSRSLRLTPSIIPPRLRQSSSRPTRRHNKINTPARRSNHQTRQHLRRNLRNHNIRLHLGRRRIRSPNPLHQQRWNFKTLSGSKNLPPTLPRKR